MTPAIETKQLTKKYGKSRGIIDIDLQIQEGEIFGFIGPNGAGKSTTIRTLLGLLKPTSGSATLFGKDIVNEGPAAREDVGYLPSEVFYYDNMRVIDLLKYSASFYKKPKRDIEIRMHELAKLLDLDLTRKIDDLSYGNKKKVGIIQGMQHSPRLLILDEPTGGLDPLMQQTFFDLLRQENKHGVTILFSSHILSEVQKLCDRVAIIKDGRIVETQSIKSLRGHNYFRCELELAAPAKKSIFANKNISDFSVHGHNIHFIWSGDVNELTRLLAGLQLTDISLEEPELEEIFLHYYKKEG